MKTNPWLFWTIIFLEIRIILKIFMRCFHQSIKVLSMTPVLQRVFQPDYGGHLSSVMNISTGDTTSTYTHEVASDLLNAHYTFRKNNAIIPKVSWHHSEMAECSSGDNLFEDKFTHRNLWTDILKTTQQINNNWSSSQHLLVSRMNSTFARKRRWLTGRCYFGIFRSGLLDAMELWQSGKLLCQFQLFAAKTPKKVIITTKHHRIHLENTNSKYFGLDYQQTINLNDSFSVNSELV